MLDGDDVTHAKVRIGVRQLSIVYCNHRPASVQHAMVRLQFMKNLSDAFDSVRGGMWLPYANFELATGHACNDLPAVLCMNVIGDFSFGVDS